MFKRRKEQSSLDQLRAMMFPRKGWLRPFYYLYYRIRRRPGGPRRIAVGVACGVGISFTPFIGFHLVTGYLLTLLIGGDVTAMVIASLIGNPWTFPVFWAMAYYLGRLLIGVTLPEVDAVTLQQLSFAEIIDKPMGLLLPMSVGGIILGLVFGLLAFYLTRSAIETYRKHRKKKIKSRRKELQERLHKMFSDVDEKS